MPTCILTLSKLKPLQPWRCLCIYFCVCVPLALLETLYIRKMDAWKDIKLYMYNPYWFQKDCCLWWSSMFMWEQQKLSLKISRMEMWLYFILSMQISHVMEIDPIVFMIGQRSLEVTVWNLCKQKISLLKGNWDVFNMEYMTNIEPFWFISFMSKVTRIKSLQTRYFKKGN